MSIQRIRPCPKPWLVSSTSPKADVTHETRHCPLDHRERGNRVIHQYLTGSPLNPNATEYASVTASHSDRVHACICSTFQTRRGHTHASLPAFSALLCGLARISRCAIRCTGVSFPFHGINRQRPMILMRRITRSPYVRSIERK